MVPQGLVPNDLGVILAEVIGQIADRVVELVRLRLKVCGFNKISLTPLRSSACERSPVSRPRSGALVLTRFDLGRDMELLWLAHAALHRVSTVCLIPSRSL